MIYFQVFAALAVSFGPFAVGLGKGYTSPALASLLPQEGNSKNANKIDPFAPYLPPLTITEQQGSWIASLSLLGALFGGLSSGLIIKHGRRKTLMFVSIPLSLSWAFTLFASCVEMIYATAFAAGFCSAIIQVKMSWNWSGIKRYSQRLFNSISAHLTSLYKWNRASFNPGELVFRHKNSVTHRPFGLFCHGRKIWLASISDGMRRSPHNASNNVTIHSRNTQLPSLHKPRIFGRKGPTVATRPGNGHVSIERFHIKSVFFDDNIFIGLPDRTR